MEKLFLLDTNEKLIEFLQQNKLIHSNLSCLKCNNETKFVKKVCGDGFGFRCTRCINKPWYSMRIDRIFFGLKSTLLEIMSIIFFWSLQLKIADLAVMLNTSENTIIKYYKCLRELCIKDFDIDNKKLGGPGTIVEIDESLMARVKHGVGHDLARKQVWVFGLKVRGKREALFFIVEKRDAEHLLPLIKKHVLPGSIIISDCWSAYNGIYKNGYEHYTVNHTYNFSLIINIKKRLIY